MSKKRTQKDRVLSMLKRGWTTPMKAIYAIGCTTLSQRAGDLLRGGHNVISERVPGKNYHRYRVLKG